MMILKTENKKLNLNITIEEEVIDKIEPENNNTVIINSEGRIIIGNKIQAKKIEKHKEIYNLSIMFNIKGNFEVKNQKDILKELKITLSSNIWINKIIKKTEDKIEQKKISLNQQNPNSLILKPLIMPIVKKIIEEHKDSYTFFKKIKDDIDFYIKLDSKEEEPLLKEVKRIINSIKEEKVSLP